MHERSKFSLLALVSDHYETLRNYNTGRRSPSDYLLLLGVPGLTALTCWIFGARAANMADVLAAVAILTGLVFSVFVLLFDLTARTLTNSSAEQHLQKTVIQLANEIRANVSYSVLVGLALSALIGGIAMFADSTKPISSPLTAIVVFGGLHLLLSIAMILKRLRSMFRMAQLRDAEERVP